MQEFRLGNTIDKREGLKRTARFFLESVPLHPKKFGHGVKGLELLIKLGTGREKKSKLTSQAGRTGCQMGRRKQSGSTRGSKIFPQSSKFFWDG